MANATAQTTAEKLVDLDVREAQLLARLATKLPAPYRRFAKMALANIAEQRARLLAQVVA